MATDFSETTLETLVADIRYAIVGGPFGSNLVSRDYVDSGVPVIRGKNMGAGKYLDGDFVFVSEDKAESLKANKARPGDIVFTQRGTLGQVAIIPDSPWETYIVSQSQMKATIDPKKADTEFLYYYFSNPVELEYIRSNAIQTGVPHINLGQLKAHPIRLPILSNQKSISHILGTLDEKIELNRQMNATQESMAQALFKSWFVDFDPVIDNALEAGNPIPGALQARVERRKALGDQRKPLPLPEHIQSQFPSSFVFSDGMGWVPEDWPTIQLEDIIELAYGKALKKSDRQAGAIPVYGSGGINGFHSSSLVEGPGIVVGRKGTVGSLFWEPQAFFPIDTVFYVKPKITYSLEYCFRLLQTLGLEHMNTDAAVPGLNRNNAYRLLVAAPPAKIVEEFSILATSLRQRIDCNHYSNKSLEDIRNSLLPKLLSGQLRIPNAEKQLAEAI